MNPAHLIDFCNRKTHLRSRRMRRRDFGDGDRGIAEAIVSATYGTRLLARLVAIVLGTSITAAHDHESVEGIASGLADDLANRRFAEVERRLSPDVAKALPESALDKLWSRLLQQGGAVRELAPPRRVNSASAGVDLVIMPIRLERMAIDLMLSIANDKVVGLFFAPAQAAAENWSAPDYVDPEKFDNIQIAVGAAPTVLPGTLSLPKSADKVPAVVLIHGSGPNDRDETIGANRPFRDIAEGLASRGVAVLRYDKRSKVYPGQIPRFFTVREETIDDALAPVALLAGRPEIDAGRIVVLGHSLGATLVPRIAEGSKDIAAAVIMAGATRPLPMVIVAQTEYLGTLEGSPDEAVRKSVAGIKAEAAAAMAAKSSDVGSSFFGAPASYWADLNAYDPAATAARLSLPMLILQGGRDYQVTEADLQGWKAALSEHPNVTIREFPSLNHLFMLGEGKSRPEEYDKPGHVDLAVIKALAGFVAGLPGRN